MVFVNNRIHSGHPCKAFRSGKWLLFRVVVVVLSYYCLYCMVHALKTPRQWCLSVWKFVSIKKKKGNEMLGLLPRTSFLYLLITKEAAGCGASGSPLLTKQRSVNRALFPLVVLHKLKVEFFSKSFVCHTITTTTYYILASTVCANSLCIAFWSPIYPMPLQHYCTSRLLATSYTPQLSSIKNFCARH